MLSNMATSLILHKRITTTTAKAKALRTFVEPLITKSKEDSTHSRRVVFSQLKDKAAVAELFREISPKIGERPGGYTRILKIGNRLGDNADMCIMELVDYNEAMLAGDTTKTKSTRRRRSARKKGEPTVETKPPKPVKEEKPKTEESIAEAETRVTEVEEPVVKTETPVAEVEEPVAKAEESTAGGEEPVADNDKNRGESLPEE